METIELAGAIVRTSDLQPLSIFSISIRPRVHPQLSDFCRSLTGVSQETVDAGFASNSSAMSCLSDWETVPAVSPGQAGATTTVGSSSRTRHVGVYLHLFVRSPTSI